MNLVPGYRIGKTVYKSSATLIYRAKRLKDKRPVIIKIPRGKYSSLEAVHRLKREYAILRGLDSPYIIKILDLSAVNGSMAAVFEDFEGRLLAELIKDEPFNLERLLELAGRIAEALDVVHQADIVHLSLNPQNILVDPKSGRLKLMDFSLAIRLDLEAPTVSNQYLFKTEPAYVSPEQTGKINLPVDHRSDLYALGAIMYEMATGRPPFAGNDPWDLAWSQLAKNPTPPHDVQTELPKQLSNIIMKLLAKAVDDRYSSAANLKKDLDECRNLLAKTGRIKEFPVQQTRAMEKFQLSQTLYGREKELEVLKNAYEEVRQGAGRMVLVAGYAGIGKTSLVNAMQRKVVEGGGLFVSGKYDQLQHNTPYIGLIEALTQLVGRLYCVRESELCLWLERIREALGPNAGVMTEFVPELENLIGNQPSPVSVGPIEARNRFHYVFTRFIHQFCRPEQPLAIFLDDLQWVDQATLRLIETLLLHTDTKHLLIFGAYRDNEVEDGHVLNKAYHEMKSQGLQVDRVGLGALELPDIGRLIRESFVMENKAEAEMVHFVFGKTGGNPFFIKQLLRSLHTEGILKFDPRRHRWEWSPKKAEKLDLSEDVLGFLAAKIAGLPTKTKKILAMAACVGFEFDLAHLSFIGEQSIVSGYKDLFPAIRAGFVLPRSELAPADPKDPLSPLVVMNYRFLHDRLEQVSYGLMDDTEKKKAHLSIGRRLLEVLNDDQRLERIFEITDHMNKGRELISNSEEKISLARLNLDAGKKAGSALAFDAAAGHLAIARQLLSSDSWQQDYGLTLGVYQESSRLECLNGNYQQAQDFIDTCLAQAESDQDKVRAYNLGIFRNTVEGNYQEIVPLGKAALKLLGFEIPDEVTPALLEKEQLEVMNLIGDRPIASLVDLPLNTDPKWDLIMKVINDIGKIISINDPIITVWMTLSIIKVMMKNGILLIDGMVVFAVYGNYQIANGNIDLGYDFGLLSVELSKKYYYSEQRCTIYAIFGDLINPWKNHFRASEYFLRESFKEGIAAGEYFYGGASLACLIYQYLFQGINLKVINDEFGHMFSITNNMSILYLKAYVLCLNNIIKNMHGLTNDRFNFDTEEISEESLIELIKDEAEPQLNFLIYKAQILYLYCNVPQSLVVFTQAEKLDFFCVGISPKTEYHFYYALVLIALLSDASPEDREQYRDKLQEHRQALKFFTEHCPANFLSRSLLVEAETARIEGRITEATDLYEKAIASAIENEFTQIEALANELAGRFWLARGHVRFARMCLIEAYNGWQRWGAVRKVEVFEEEFLDYIQPRAANMLPAQTSVSVEAESSESGPESWDRVAVVKAAQTISGEMDLDRLVAKLMNIVVQYSGAQKCFVIFREQDAFIIRAQEETERSNADSWVSRPVDDCPHLCVPVVYRTARSQASLVLEDAVREGDFTHDEYVRKNLVRSLLCLPIISQRNVTGLLYLENNMLPGVFGPDRLEVLEILAAQAAISIDIAGLYAFLTEQTKSLEEANAALKVLLAERDKDRMEQEKNLLATLKQIVFPYTDKLKGTKLSPDQKTYLDVLETNLQDLTSSYARHLASPEFGLTPMEMQVAELIKDGQTSDEIADLLHISLGTVSFHRSNIRTKLGLSGKKVNLRNHLLSLMNE